MEATETKRRIPRKRVRLVKVTVDGAEVDGKECTKCGVVKALTDFYPNSAGKGGKTSQCKDCTRRQRESNPEKFRERDRKYHESNQEKVSEKFRRWCETNPERVRERKREYREANREKKRASDQRRKALKHALPSAWTAANESRMYECSLTQLSEDTHVDHVIPLGWGHGGSYVGNMIPLSSTLNISKSDAHLYEWFETNRQRFELDRSRFDDMIAIIAAQNGLTPDEYRQYYDWCYANRRSFAQTKADNERYGYVVSSLELWREATGIPFPVRIDFGEKAVTKRSVRTRKESEVTA